MPSFTPLPERLRPETLDQVCGQEHLLGDEGVLSGFIADGRVPSLLLWGPPGCGKTTIARLVADAVGLRFAPFSAVLGGLADLRKLIAEAESMHNLGEHTLLFIDEIHRFNKAQQDALLPHVENGTVTLIGATTENPSFSCNRALLSRCRVFQLHELDHQAQKDLLDRVCSHEEGISDLEIEDEALEPLFRYSSGDGRRLQLMLEEAWALSRPAAISLAHIKQVASGVRPGHDKSGDSHYDVASA
ncbi:MAG: AAA family ATPase, partial [Planctomycetes bacterium]|nr:AAA family ATPase [Planctomycetota bacterium]